MDPLETLGTALADRYRVERLLGSGGMATVYLAHDLKHDRAVAIKVLRPELSAALGSERFLREIRIAAQLNHPHILTLHDSGEAGGLLYYVMPYVAGESLQERLSRERQLSVRDAIRIVQEVASALGYAHAHGVVHRDIKPGNILLSDGYALVADFGLARAISHAKSDDSITHSGLTIGTPTYMSPEQADGESGLDGRSDIYALGCVLYELLLGDPPFVASSSAAVLARHATARPLSIRALRPTVPVGVERAIMRALEKLPADRFQTAEEFAEALREGDQSGRGAELPRWIARGAMLAVGIGLLALLAREIGGRSGTAAGGADTARYAVFPFADAGNSAPNLNSDQLLQQALSRWSGISVVDHFDVVAAIGRMPGGVSSAEAATAVAERLKAGRFVLGDVSLSGDSLRVHAALYAATGARLGDATARVGRTLAKVDSVFAGLADSLLFHGLPPRGWSESGGGTHSLPALQEFARGQSAIDTWDLVAADSAFSSALVYDPGYVQGALWLAQVRAWDNQAPARWRFSAEKALAGRGQLSARDQILAQALAALARREFETACPLWRQLTAIDPTSFAAWYGRAQCVKSDNVVLRDPRSPSTWRYRSSYDEAVHAYARAFELLPAIHRAFQAGSYERLRDLLFVRGNSLRPGRALPPDTGSFLAQPGWVGDSLVFVPYRAMQIMSGSPGTLPPTFREAVLHQRQVFREIATGWAAAEPQSAEAIEALAIALELLGDPSALDTLRRARGLANSESARVRVAAAELWLALKFALPDDLTSLRRARSLADSLLEGRGGSTDASAILLPIAALTGRVVLAARLSRMPGALGQLQIHPAIAGSAPALLIFAAFGGPADSLAQLTRLVVSGLESGIPEPAREDNRLEWLARAATLAFPAPLPPWTTNPTANVDVLYDAQIAFQSGRRNEALAAFPRLRLARAGLLPEAVSFDAILPEARLLVELGLPDSAAAWLDPALGAVRLVPGESLAGAASAASLVRAMALRAELASQAGDSATAGRWARSVIVLWSGADASLQPILTRMSRLAQKQGGAP